MRHQRAFRHCFNPVDAALIYHMLATTGDFDGSVVMQDTQSLCQDIRITRKRYISAFFVVVLRTTESPASPQTIKRCLVGVYFMTVT